MSAVPFLKRNLLALLLLYGLSTPARCQIGIDESNPDPSSILDIKSADKGLLIPRLTRGNRLSLGTNSPGNSLLVFDTDENRFFYYSTAFSTWFSLMAIKPGPDWNTYTGNLELVGNVKANKFTGDGIIPQGGIIMWSGSVSAIPAGWALCDGQNGTPNLKDKFIMGAGGGYNPGNTGGNATVTLSVDQLPGHTHTPGTLHIISSGSHEHTTNAGQQESKAVGKNGTGAGEGAQSPGSAAAVTGAGEGSHTHASTDFAGETGSTGKNQAVNIIPPYYVLAFIMKL